MTDLFEVCESVFCVRRPLYLSCSYFVVRERDVILIDSGMDPTGAEMAECLNRVGRSAEDIRAIFLTHWHTDHSSGAAELQKRSGASIYYHVAGAEKFRRGAASSGWREKLAKRIPERGLGAPFRGLLQSAPIHPVEATRHVEDGELLEDGFRVLETPGHELGHLSFFFEPAGVLFAGDALAVARNRITFMSRFLTVDRSAAKESMLRCLDLPMKALCPGHSRPLQPSTFEIDRIRRVLEKLRWWPVIG